MEEDLCVVQNLHGLISQHLPCDKSRILAVKYSKFSADDYGVTVLKLSVELVNSTTGEDWTLEALAKVLPRQCSDLVKRSFVSEIGVHTLAQNTIDLFLREKDSRADFFPSSFGGRLNLNGSKEIDNNAVLILEDRFGKPNVHHGTTIGFTLAPQIGFNLDTTEKILKTLAKFHSSTLALKLQNPEDFNTKIRPYLHQVFKKSPFDEAASARMIKILKQEGVPIKIIERAVVAFNRKFANDVREPWATFCHGNLWIKNILIKNRNKEIKFINFQECQYNSPLMDLLYFLFSSVQLEVLRQNLDALIDFYYENFQLFLKQFNNDEINSFSRHYFNEELNATASKCQFYKTVLGIFDTVDVERLCFIVKEFDKRNWLSL